MTDRTLAYWYAYCPHCDWTGQQQPTEDDARRDADGHSFKHRWTHVAVTVREGVLEEIL